jgi:hypothetical protein
MDAKKADPTTALVAVIKALEPLKEPDRQWVLQSAASKFNATIQQHAGAGNNGGTTTPAGSGGAPAGVQSSIAKKDPRAFIRIKKPSTDVQRVACLGYYLSQTTGKHGFTSKEVTQAHTDSGGSAINMTRALDNATRGSNYLSNRGPREKQLTTLGEDVVNALPDQAAVKAVEESGKRGGKKRKKA